MLLCLWPRFPLACVFAALPSLAIRTRCFKLQQALAVLKSASDEEVERVVSAYGVRRPPLKQLRDVLPDRKDVYIGRACSRPAAPLSQPRLCGCPGLAARPSGCASRWQANQTRSTCPTRVPSPLCVAVIMLEV